MEKAQNKLSKIESLSVRASAKAQVFVSDLNLSSITEQDFHHLSRVLRLKDGEKVIACDGKGKWQLCLWSNKNGLESVGGQNGGPHQEALPNELVHIAFAIPKGERLEWTVQKLTEIGVDLITLMTTDHTVVKWDSLKQEKNLERLRKIIESAAAQSRRVFLPKLQGLFGFDEVLAANPLIAVVAQMGGGNFDDIFTKQRDGDSKKIDVGSQYLLLTGPEGGWSSRELNQVAKLVALTDSVLRAETAAIVGATLLINHRVS